MQKNLIKLLLGLVMMSTFAGCAGLGTKEDDDTNPTIEWNDGSNEGPH